MIANFNSNIEIEPHTIMNSDVHRSYLVVQNNNTIATGWVKDIIDYHSLKGFKDSVSFKTTKDRDGSFTFNGQEYRIGEDVRYGSEWPFYDSKGDLVMSLRDDSEKVQVEVKKFLSKKTEMKQRSIHFHKITTVNGNEYRMYDDISLGKDGEYYVMYKNNVVVSTIYLNPQMHNYGRTMDLYIEDETEVILITLLYCFMLVMYNFYRDNTTTIQENGNYKFSMPKSKDYKLDKLDQNFIEKIKQQASYEQEIE